MDISDLNNLNVWFPASIISDSTTEYNTTIISGTLNIEAATDVTLFSNVQYANPPDKDWMPYSHFEYEPVWHKKYAAIKYQMESMWD